MKMNRRDVARAGGIAAGIALMGAAMSKTVSACTDDDLAKAVEEFRQAMVDGNGARLLELSSDSMSFGHANGVVQTKIEFVKTVVDKAEIFNSIRLSNHTYKVDGAVGIARHTFDADIIFQGKPIQLSLGILMVWRNEDGRWRLVARQSFKPITV
jgi:ketosteroid isomerase-like protein